MDILFNPFLLLTVSLLGLLVVLLRYSIKAIHRLGVSGYLSQLGRIGKVFGIIVGLVFALIATFRDLFVTKDILDEEEYDKEGDLTGVYNFCTRKFDNGTDPYGWYEEDL